MHSLLVLCFGMLKLQPGVFHKSTFVQGHAFTLLEIQDKPIILRGGKEQIGKNT